MFFQERINDIWKTRLEEKKKKKIISKKYFYIKVRETGSEGF